MEFVDALRGFALFGVFGANLLIFSGIDYMTDAQRVARFPSALDRAAFFLERFFVETKFMGLFSAQVALADVWMGRFRFGPAEWVWRCLTYRRIEPFRRTEPLPYGGNRR